MDKFFQISQRGSTVAREIRGGVVTFFTMAYIVVLNPLIVGTAKDAHGQFLGGMAPPHNFAAIAAATALVAGIMSILMGVVANYPLAIATGLGLNAFVAFAIASQMTWADAMGLVVLEGLVILLLVLTGFRTAVFRAVPSEIKTAISVGIGLFIALIGFVDAGFVRRTGVGPVPVQLGTDGFLNGWPVLVFCVGLVLIVGLYVRRVKGAILIGIVATTILAVIVEAIGHIGPMVAPDGKVNPTGWNLNTPKLPGQIISSPHFDTVWHFSLLGSFKDVGLVTALLLLFTLVLADFFDALGTLTAIGAEAGLLDEDHIPPRLERILVVDAAAAAAGGVAGVSSNTGFIESASGVAEGARTGLASVVTGVLFLISMVFAPLVEVVPSEAAVPALVLVGFLMLQQVRTIDWTDLDVAIPAFLTIVLMPFTYSITVGIGAGFVSYAAIKLIRGRVRDVHPLLWVVSFFFVVYFAIDPIKSLFA